MVIGKLDIGIKFPNVYLYFAYIQYITSVHMSTQNIGSNQTNILSILYYRYYPYLLACFSNCSDISVVVDYYKVSLRPFLWLMNHDETMTMNRHHVNNEFVLDSIHLFVTQVRMLLANIFDVLYTLFYIHQCTD